MAITFDLAGVRSSPSHSERFSPMPFRKIPFQTQKTKIEKKIFCRGQTDSTLTDPENLLPDDHHLLEEDFDALGRASALDK